MTVNSVTDAERILNRVLDVCAQDASAALITQGRAALAFLVEQATPKGTLTDERAMEIVAEELERIKLEVGE